MVTLYPLACNSLPIDEDIIPLPSDEATPPVTNIYFVSPIKLVYVLFNKLKSNHIMLTYFKRTKLGKKEDLGINNLNKIIKKRK